MNESTLADQEQAIRLMIAYQDAEDRIRAFLKLRNVAFVDPVISLERYIAEQTVTAARKQEAVA